MPFDPNKFPVIENDDNKILYRPGNAVKNPQTGLFVEVVKLVLGKPGGTMLVCAKDLNSDS